MWVIPIDIYLIEIKTDTKFIRLKCIINALHVNINIVLYEKYSLQNKNRVFKKLL